MEPATGTLIAATIAACSSVVSLAANGFVSRRAEMRSAHRELLGTSLEELATAQHEIMATSNLIRRRLLNDQDVTDWITRGTTAKEALLAIRLRVRYPLWGLEESLRTLSRLPEWVATHRNLQGGSAQALLDEAGRLSARTDQIIRRSYKRGMPPSWRERWLAQRRVEKVRKVWEHRFKERPARWWDLPQRLRSWRAPRPAPVLDVPEA